MVYSVAFLAVEAWEGRVPRVFFSRLVEDVFTTTRRIVWSSNILQSNLQAPFFVVVVVGVV